MLSANNAMAASYVAGTSAVPAYVGLRGLHASPMHAMSSSCSSSRTNGLVGRHVSRAIGQGNSLQQASIFPLQRMSAKGRPRSVRCSVQTEVRESSSDTTELNEGIAKFYDQSSGVWEDMWGEHMHHGFYPPGAKNVDHKQAQIDLIEEALKFAGVPDGTTGGLAPKRILDVGCGIGGSSRFLVRKYSGAKSTGITLSPVQAARAMYLSQEQGLGDKNSFLVADALQQPFEDASFDLVYSMESGEHMPDKQAFVKELARVAAPGGSILIVTWCHRDLQPGESSLKPQETDLLRRICDAYYLPDWCSAVTYKALCEENGLEDVRLTDWSTEVSPFWPAVVASALTPKGLIGLLKSGATTIRGAFAMALMIQGFRQGLIKFAVIAARKPI